MLSTEGERVFIVGGGPMCVYALERLAAYATTGSSLANIFSITVIERSGNFGAGEVNSDLQSTTSCMNRVAAQVGFSADESNREAGPLLPKSLRPTLYEWLRRRHAETGNSRFALQPASIPSRQLHGEALKEMFETYCGLLRAAGMHIDLVKAEVVDVSPAPSNAYWFVHTACDQQLLADRILFVTGNAQSFARTHRTSLTLSRSPRIIAPAYPLEQQMAAHAVPPGCVVGVDGLGLTAIDVVLHLTEGRGGRFDPVATDTVSRLRYLPSGNEPKRIIAFSPSGMLPSCRPENFKLEDASLHHEGRFFTLDAVALLRNSYGRAVVLSDGRLVRQLDFDENVLPVIILEMGWLYYATLLGPAFGLQSEDAVRARYDAFLSGSGPAGKEAIEHLLAPLHTCYATAICEVPVFGADKEQRFNWRRLLWPLAPEGDLSAVPWRTRVVRFMQQDLLDGREGNLRNPLKVACDGVLRDLRSVFCAVVDHGGLTPKSHRRFLGSFMRCYMRLSNGAGIEPTTKLLTLIEQGLLDVDIGPQPVVELSGNDFLVKGSWTGVSRRVQLIVHARLAPFDASDPGNALYPNLMRRGLVRKWVNTGSDGDCFYPGGLELTDAGHPISHDGEAEERLTFLGVPAEGQRFFQSAAARPNCNSSLFNTLSRWAEQALRNEPARQMHLGAFLYPTGYHVAAWRHPDVPSDAGINFSHAAQVAALAERGKFDFLFLADSLAIRGRDLPALSRTAIRYVAQFEPLTLLSALAVVTRKIGLVASASTTYNEPYHLARKLASIDHLSSGRCGWNLVTSQNEDEAYNFGLEVHPPHARRYKRAREFTQVVKGLWDSWEDDAFPRDKEAGLFFDPNKVHMLDHRGEHFSVRGPLNIPRTPQGYPVLIQSGSSEAGKELAAEMAEVVFTAQSRLEDAQAFYADLKGRLPRYGRAGHDLKIIVGVFPYVGRTRAEAEEKRRHLQALIDPVVGLSLLATQLSGVDLSGWPLDGPLPDIPDTNAGKSRRDLLVAMAQRERLTIRQLYERVAASRGHWTIAGTPQDIVDELESWWHADAADGFTVMGPTLPEGLESFVELVVPLLQERGLFRRDYKGRTLREHLGLARPPHPKAAGREANSDSTRH